MTGAVVRVEPAGSTDLAGIRGLLEAAGLPTQHLDDGSARLYVVREVGGDPGSASEPGARALEPLGCAGLERHGTAGLLRSLAVHETARGRGVGRALVERIAAEALAAGAAELVLLTMGAGRFFLDLGFEPARREAFDPALLDSWEFRLHECVPAELLRRRLTAGLDRSS